MFNPIDHQLLLHGWRLSFHARERLHQRGVSASLLVRALTDPDVSYPHDGNTALVAGQLRVIVDSTSRTVISLGPNATGESWGDDAAARAIFADLGTAA